VKICFLNQKVINKKSWNCKTIMSLLKTKKRAKSINSELISEINTLVDIIDEIGTSEDPLEFDWDNSWLKGDYFSE
jgi:hypothetical protein